MENEENKNKNYISEEDAKMKEYIDIYHDNMCAAMDNIEDDELFNYYTKKVEESNNNLAYDNISKGLIYGKEEIINLLEFYLDKNNTKKSKFLSFILNKYYKDSLNKIFNKYLKDELFERCEILKDFIK